MSLFHELLVKDVGSVIKIQWLFRYDFLIICSICVSCDLVPCQLRRFLCMPGGGLSQPTREEEEQQKEIGELWGSLLTGRHTFQKMHSKLVIIAVKTH